MVRALGTIVVLLLELFEIALFIRVIFSWLPIYKENQYIRLLYSVTEPVLSPIRAMLERSAFGRNMGMIDLSPIIAFLAIDLAKRIISRAMYVSPFIW
ncbi:MAG: YggT family protein [Clostridia bacterium]|nr:YggT family protein [Clostridia bacterium]